MKKLFTILLLAFGIHGFCQLPVTDTLFGNNGEVFSSPLGGTSGASTNIFRQADDKILLCGYTYGVGNNYVNTMFRTDCNGKIDSTFGVNGLVKHRFEEKNKAYSYALLNSGKIAAVGIQATTAALADQLPFIARYNTDGSPDTTFGGMGSIKLGSNTKELSSVYSLSDGKLLATGGLFLARFDSIGELDLSFGTNGMLDIPSPPGFAATPLTGYRKANSVMRTDGKIISAMPAYFNATGDYNASFICYDTGGMVDSSFGTNGYFKDNNFFINNQPPRLLAQSNNKVICVREYVYGDKILMARYNPDGSLDSTFGINGYAEIVSQIPPITLEYVSKYADNSFLIGFSDDFQPSQFRKFTMDGVDIPAFSLNGSDTFQFGNNQAERADAGLTSSNNEIIMGSMSGYGNCRAAITKFSASSAKPNLIQSGNTLHSNVTNSGATFQWLFNGNAITDSTGSSLTATQNGTYSVIVTNSWGCESSSEVLVSNIISGIQESLVDRLSVYPNPASSILHITWNGNNNNTTVELLDMTGRIVLRQYLSDVNQTDITVQQLAKGMYLLQVSNENITSTKKISIE